ncbi:hypothetical protein STEG23_015505, partial [Scotinomys teguina]
YCGSHGKKPGFESDTTCLLMAFLNPALVKDCDSGPNLPSPSLSVLSTNQDEILLPEYMKEDDRQGCSFLAAALMTGSSAMSVRATDSDEGGQDPSLKLLVILVWASDT